MYVNYIYVLYVYAIFNFKSCKQGWANLTSKFTTYVAQVKLIRLRAKR